MLNTALIDNAALVTSCYEAWSVRDVPGILELLGETCTYTLHVPVEVLEFGGQHTGKAAIGGCLEAMLVEFSYLAFAVDRLVVRDDIVRAQVVYYCNHNESGHCLNGRFRHVWQVVNGRVVSLDEYHDVPMLKSFLEMVTGMRKT